jgi:hypothetical protein
MRIAHLPVSPVSDSVDHIQLLTSPHNFCLCVSRQRIHEFIKSSAIILSQGRFQRMAESAFQAALPAFPAVVQIGSPAGQLTGRVDLHSISRPDNTHQRPLGQDFTATHARPLGHMFHTLNRFLRHLHSKSLHADIVKRQ